jgi:hypothetical protein
MASCWLHRVVRPGSAEGGGIEGGREGGRVGAKQASTDSCLRLTSISASVRPFFTRNLPTRCKLADGISPRVMCFMEGVRFEQVAGPGELTFCGLRATRSGSSGA